MNGKVKSIDRALDILEAFSEQKTELSITELSKILRMKTSTVHRILTTLKEREYIKQSSPKAKYKLGIKAFELGCIFRSQMHFTKIAMPYLRYLCNLTKETTHLAILDDSSAEVIYIAQVASPEPLRTAVGVGTRWRAHCTAIGKVLLAFLPQEKIEQMFLNQRKLPTYTPNSISDVNELKRHLKKVRTQGFAIDNEEFGMGIRCLGAPIRDDNGKVIAAVSIAGPATRFSKEKAEELKGTIMNVCNEMSSELGFKEIE